MNTKLTTAAQVALLRTGDTIKRFPINCDRGPQNVFDELLPLQIGTYEIRTINNETGVLLLVTANSRTLTLASPVDVGRLYIKATDLVRESVWWVNSRK